jgi:hypothetical protein
MTLTSEDDESRLAFTGFNLSNLVQTSKRSKRSSVSAAAIGVRVRRRIAVAYGSEGVLHDSTRSSETNWRG